jgi:hypothetical protein
VRARVSSYGLLGRELGWWWADSEEWGRRLRHDGAMVWDWEDAVIKEDGGND